MNSLFLSLENEIVLVFDCLLWPKWIAFACHFVECSGGFVIFILYEYERMQKCKSKKYPFFEWGAGVTYLHKNLTHPICLGGVADPITAHLTDNARFPGRGRGWPGIMLTMPMWISSALILLLRGQTVTVNLIRSMQQHNIVLGTYNRYHRLAPARNKGDGRWLLRESQLRR